MLNLLLKQRNFSSITRRIDISLSSPTTSESNNSNISIQEINKEDDGNKTILFNVSNYPLHIPEIMERSEKEAKIAKNIKLADFTNSGKVRCYNCGVMGHLSIDCSKPQVMKACYYCGNPGHMARQWYCLLFLIFSPQKNSIKVCSYCRKDGHEIHDCPSKG